MRVPERNSSPKFWTQKSPIQYTTNTRDSGHFLARRARLAFLNAQLALDVLPKVVRIMAQEVRQSVSARGRGTQARGRGG
jgi:glycerol-3-phosphate dehydrogenase